MARAIIHFSTSFIYTNELIEDDMLLRREVTIPHSQILTLPTVPVEIVAAVGSGKLLVPVTAIARSNIAAGDYTNFGVADNNLSWIYLTFGSGGPFASTQVYSSILLSDSVSGSGTTPIAIFSQGSQIDAQISPPNITTFSAQQLPIMDGNSNSYINRGLFLDTSQTTDFGSGNSANTLKVIIYYIVVDV